MSTFLRFLREKWNPPLLPPNASFKGQTVLITGANTGLGFHAARQFLDLDAAQVILGVRSTVKGDAAKARLEQATDGPTKRGTVTVLPLDMNSFASVRDFAARVASEVDRVDVAVLNAGVHKRHRVVGPEGWEETLQVNTLSTTLLALLLLPVLRRTGAAARRSDKDPGGGEGPAQSKLPSSSSSSSSSPPRLVLVSSGTHSAITPKQLPDPTSTENIFTYLSSGGAGAEKAKPDAAKSFWGPYQYGLSKFLLMCNLGPLSRLGNGERLLRDASSDADAATADGKEEGDAVVVVTSCCPGFCKSELGRQYDDWWLRPLIAAFEALFLKTTEEGARVYVSAATVEGEGAQGGYWKSDRLER